MKNLRHLTEPRPKSEAQNKVFASAGRPKRQEARGRVSLVLDLPSNQTDPSAAADDGAAAALPVTRDLERVVTAAARKAASGLSLLNRACFAWVPFSAVILAIAMHEPARAHECDTAQTIRIAGFEYESGSFSAALIKELIERGYGCKTSITVGTTLGHIRGLLSGELDILSEVWVRDAPSAWEQALIEGEVVQLGRAFVDEEEGWFIPAYSVSAAERASGFVELRNLSSLFNVSSEPSNTSRFYNCPLGFQCEAINTRKLRVYGIDRAFTNYIPENLKALERAVRFAVEHRDPILFYYWKPSALISSADFIKVREPPFNEKTWAILRSDPNAIDACASPNTGVVIGGSKRFVETSPGVAVMLQKIDLANQSVLAEVVDIGAEKKSATEAAQTFLREHRAIWRSWVPADVEERIASSLR